METKTLVRDPVCGMEIEPKDAFTTRQVDEQTFYFCSQSCVDRFDADPHKYTIPSQVKVENPVKIEQSSSYEKILAGSITTGFNPALPLAVVNFPILGLKKSGEKALEMSLAEIPGVQSIKANAGTGREAIPRISL